MLSPDKKRASLDEDSMIIMTMIMPFVAISLLFGVMVIFGRMAGLAAIAGFPVIFMTILLMRLSHESGVSGYRNMVTHLVFGGIGAFMSIAMLYDNTILPSGDMKGELYHSPMLPGVLMIAAMARFGLPDLTYSHSRLGRIIVVLFHLWIATIYAPFTAAYMPPLPSWTQGLDGFRAVGMALAVHGKTKIKADGELKAEKLTTTETALLAIVAIPWEHAVPWLIA